MWSAKTILGAGIFSMVAGTHDIQVSGIWWLWVVITLPLTLLVVCCWRYYSYRKEKSNRARIEDLSRRVSMASKDETSGGDLEYALRTVSSQDPWTARIAHAHGS